MRLDKFLKTSRILKRRTVAADACKGGRILVNGKEAKPAHTLKTGDELTVLFGEGENAKAFKVRILELNEKAGKADAASMYEILNDNENN